MLQGVFLRQQWRRLMTDPLWVAFTFVPEGINWKAFDWCAALVLLLGDLIRNDWTKFLCESVESGYLSTLSPGLPRRSFSALSLSLPFAYSVAPKEMALCTFKNSRESWFWQPSKIIQSGIDWSLLFTRTISEGKNVYQVNYTHSVQPVGAAMLCDQALILHASCNRALEVASKRNTTQSWLKQ